MDERIEKLVLFILSNKQEPFFSHEYEEIRKLKQIDALNRKLIPRVSNYSDEEIFQHYKRTISVIQTVLELKLNNDDEIDQLLRQYSINISNANELRKLLVLFCKIGLESIK